MPTTCHAEHKHTRTCTQPVSQYHKPARGDHTLMEAVYPHLHSPLVLEGAGSPSPLVLEDDGPPPSFVLVGAGPPFPLVLERAGHSSLFLLEGV